MTSPLVWSPAVARKGMAAHSLQRPVCISVPRLPWDGLWSALSSGTLGVVALDEHKVPLARGRAQCLREHCPLARASLGLCSGLGVWRPASRSFDVEMLHTRRWARHHTHFFKFLQSDSTVDGLFPISEWGN